MFEEEPFHMNFEYGEDVPKEIVKQKIKDVLELTIDDLPFGRTISKEYRNALAKVIYYIMYYNKEQKIATLPMITGGGKSTALINATSYMVNDPVLFKYSGTIILKLTQNDCEETANAINKKSSKEVAYAYHSGKSNYTKCTNKQKIKY